jgi:hypothetical protein
VAKVEVRVVPQGRGYRLDLYREGVNIGEYERSWAAEESGDLNAKVREAEGASDLLIEASERTANGKVTVRWNGETREKEIRTYAEGRSDPGRGEPAISLIPKPYWRKP